MSFIYQFSAAAIFVLFISLLFSTSLTTLIMLLVLLVLSISAFASSLPGINKSAGKESSEDFADPLSLKDFNEDPHLFQDFLEYRLINSELKRAKRNEDDIVSKPTDVTNMSRNITLVLENLLKNYESSQLPSHGKGVPTVVRTNILIRSMGPVSELDMDYSMDCYFRQYWRDSRLSFMGPIKSLSLSIKMLERIWRPDTYFYNGKQSYVHTITVPNKLLRISQEGDILYSMRLTIKAKCPMELRNFPMDSQSCPLVLGSYAYSSKNLVYEWQAGESVSFVPGMTLSQFDLMGSPRRNLTLIREREEYSILQVNFNLQRNTGYFVIQVYVPCVLIVVLSWVSFWIHREATSDRVGLGITTVLTLSTISLDSRTDLPKVGYATALDWFLLMSFFYCIATLLEFAGVHYFTKVGSGEIFINEEEWEDADDAEMISGYDVIENQLPKYNQRRSSLLCPIYNDSKAFGSPSRHFICDEKSDNPSSAFSKDSSHQSEKDHNGSFTLIVKMKNVEENGKPEPNKFSVFSEAIQNESTLRRSDKYRRWSRTEYQEKLSKEKRTIEKETQTEKKISKMRQLIFCIVGDDLFRKQRQREAALRLEADGGFKRHVNSVSSIDQIARIIFPLSFASLNLFYWFFYLYADYPRIDF